MLSLYDDYVCVRVTDMRGVDLKRYAFDFDLTFGALLMHPDGHVYHRYGGRDYRGASRWLSAASFEGLLEHTLLDHGAYRVAEAIGVHEPLRIENIPAFQKRDRGECIHCHSVFPAFYEEEQAAGSWKQEKIWKYPSPLQLGMDLDRDDQRRVTEVLPNSPAKAAGLLVGDRLQHLAGVEVMSASDVMFLLDSVAWEGATLALELERAGEPLSLKLQLPSGWRKGSALSFSWRPFKWGLKPAPGFGGQQLSRQELIAAGLIDAADPGAKRFALRVTYLVTWGENKRFGQAAARAGLRDGDVVLCVAGKSDFETPDHLHAWWRLHYQPGDEIEIELQRAGKPRTIHMKVID